MAYVWQRWLLTELRDAGLDVVPVAGWENRGRPATTGHFDPRGPVTTHHTGTTTSATDPFASLDTLIRGRSDLPGPLSQVGTAWDGTLYLIAAGRANHAGRVGKINDVPGMPMLADGNAAAIGNEVMTNGTQPLTQAQRHTIAVFNAVVLRHFDHENDLRYVHRHADISGTGKWDIGQLSTTELRTITREALDKEPPAMPLTPAEIEAVSQATVERLLTTKIPTKNPGDPKAVPAKDWDIATILRNLELEQDRARQHSHATTEAILDRLAALTEAVKVLGGDEPGAPTPPFA